MGYGWEKFSLVQPQFFTSSLESPPSAVLRDGRMDGQQIRGGVSGCGLRGAAALPLAQLLRQLLAVPWTVAEAAAEVKVIEARFVLLISNCHFDM